MSKANKQWGWLLIGLLMGMIIGVLTWPEEAWGAEPVLIIPDGQSIVEDINHPDGAQIDEALAYLAENRVEVPEDIEMICQQVGKDNNIASELLEAIIWKESRFKPEVVDASGNCHGLMQINKGSHRARMARLGVSDLYNPKDNIRVGADYLRELFDRYNDTATALEAYNGDGAAAENLQRDSAYAQKVMKISQALERAKYK